MRMNFLAAAAAGALALGFAATPSSALAVVFATAGDTSIIDFNGFVDGSPDADLDADLTLTLLSITGTTDYNFSYSLTNNSSGDDLLSRLTAFGFNVDPDFDDASVSGEFTTWASGNVPGSLDDVEFCATDVNCSGGGGDGVFVGETGTGLLTLSFLSDPGAGGIDLTNFYVRYQSLGADGEGSGVGNGGPCVEGEDDCGGGGGNEIPEPGTWALMILGFGGVGAMLRRRRGILTPA
jgi:hypothetical protein